MKSFLKKVFVNKSFLLLAISLVVFFIGWNFEIITVRVFSLLFVVVFFSGYYFNVALKLEKNRAQRINYTLLVLSLFLFSAAYISAVVGEAHIAVWSLVAAVFFIILSQIIGYSSDLMNSRELPQTIIAYVVLSLVLIILFSGFYAFSGPTSESAQLDGIDLILCSGQTFYSTDFSVTCPSGQVTQLVQLFETVLAVIIHVIILAIVVARVFYEGNLPKEVEKK